MLIDKYREWWPVHQAERILADEAARKQRYIRCGAYVLATYQGVFGIPPSVVDPPLAHDTLFEA